MLFKAMHGINMWCVLAEIQEAQCFYICRVPNLQQDKTNLCFSQPGRKESIIQIWKDFPVNPRFWELVHISSAEEQSENLWLSLLT